MLSARRAGEKNVDAKFKSIVKEFVPPVVFSLRRKLHNKLINLGEKPTQQDLDIYWDENYANTLDSWGKGTVWVEIVLIFLTLEGKVLDMACATGSAIEILSKKNSNIDIYGFDISDLLINIAIEKGIDETKLKVADATVTTYLENEFDYSYSIGALAHFTLEGINLFLKNAAFYTKKFSFHQIPINKYETDNGWVKYEESYFQNSTEWWLKKFEKYFSKVDVLESTWTGYELIGKWFICKK